MGNYQRNKTNIPQNVEEIRKSARQVEVFSINMTEAKSMLGVSGKEEIVSELEKLL